MTPHLDGNALLARLREGDLDAYDVGDFLDLHLDGENPAASHIGVLDGVASAFRASLPPLGRRLEAWRMVLVAGDPDAWAAEPTGPDGIGLCWSFEPDGAAPYGGGLERGARRILHGRVDPADVDWAATCIMQAVKPDQAECRLVPDASVEVVAILDGHTRRPLACPRAGESFPAAHPFASPKP